MARRNRYPRDLFAWRRLGRDLLLTTALAVAIGGWWLMRNQVLYGDPLAQSAFVGAFEDRPSPQEYMARYDVPLPFYLIQVTLWTCASALGVFGPVHSNLFVFFPVWVYVLVGLSFFLEGLEMALFPLGKVMAAQLTDPAFLRPLEDAAEAVQMHWWDYRWVYLFAFLLGFATTIAEPSLLAVALMANQVSGGSIGVWGLRVAVALGVAVGIALGAYRIISGTPLHWYIIVGYIVVVVQTAFAPRMMYQCSGVPEMMR